MTSSRQHQNGFTLLEMILAISLMTLLAALAYGMLRIGIRGWETADTHADRSDAMRVAWPFLHHTLESARPLVSLGGPGQPMDGDDSKLSWISELPAHFIAGGPQRLTLMIDQNSASDRQQLVLIAAPINAESDNAENNQRAVLVDELKHFQINYYGQSAGGGAAQWSSTWRDHPALPQLIRLDIEPKNAPAWPTLYAHPYLANALPASSNFNDTEPEQ